MTAASFDLAPPLPIATAPRSRRARPRASVIPGFGLTMGLTVAWLSLVVLIPLSTLFVRAAGMSLADFVDAGFSDRALAAYRVSVVTAFCAALINAVFGVLIAWVFVRYDFPGKRLFDALIDLPFALPTAVAGIALTAIYDSNGSIGGFLSTLGIDVAYTLPGITIALIFIGLPFIVRTVQPVLEDLSADIEEAALSLGATPVQVFVRILFPAILPALLTGFALALARGVGEYGSVIFIAGNMPFKTEIAPLLIVTQLEQYDYDGATAIAVVMLLIAFAMLLAINLVQAWNRRRTAS